MLPLFRRSSRRGRRFRHLLGRSGCDHRNGLPFVIVFMPHELYNKKGHAAHDHEYRKHQEHELQDLKPSSPAPSLGPFGLAHSSSVALLLARVAFSVFIRHLCISKEIHYNTINARFPLTFCNAHSII